MELMETNSEKEIAKEFFREFTNTTKVSKKIYPKSFKNNLRKKNVGIVSDSFSKWKDAGYIEEKSIFKEKVNKKNTKYTQKIKAYRLNLNPFFQEFKKVNKTEIPIELKRFIELCFEVPGLRKEFVRFCKDKDLFYMFENVVKGILLFITEETHKFKDQEPINMFKRERFVYMMALPQIKDRVQKYLFDKKGASVEARGDIIAKLEEIYRNYIDKEKRIKEDFEKQDHPHPTESPAGFFRTRGNTILSAWDFFNVEKEQEFIYIFHECDSDKSDILISLIKFFSDTFAHVLFTEKLNRQLETARNELTKTHGSEYILDKIKQEELTQLRAFFSMYLIKKRMIDRDDAKSLIKKLRELNGIKFENMKKLYIVSKINNLMKKDEILTYCINKLNSHEANLRIKGKKQVKEIHREMAKKGIKDDSLYPAPKEKYVERWADLLRDISTSDIIADLNKIIRD